MTKAQPLQRLGLECEVSVMFLHLLTLALLTTPEPPRGVPPGAAAFAVFRVADIVRHPSGPGLIAALNQRTPDALKNLEGFLGVPVDAVDTFTVVVPDLAADFLSHDDAALTFDLNRPITVDALLKVHSDGTPPRAGLYASKLVAGGELLISSDRRFTLYTSAKARRATADAWLRPASGVLAGAYALAAEKPAIALGIDPTALRGQRPGPGSTLAERAVFPVLDATALTLRLDPGLPAAAKLRISYAEPADAVRAAKALPVFRLVAAGEMARRIAIFKDQKQFLRADWMSAYLDALKAAEFASADNTVVVTTTLSVDAPLAGYFDELKLTPARAETERLRNIAIGLHNYESALGIFPAAAICDKKSGKPLLSWRVTVLPYVEQGALYRRFHLDEPWDSEHNKKLLTEMPLVYRSPGPAAEPGTTRYRAFVGNGALFELRKGVGFANIRDGLSNTILVAVAEDAVPWTKPEELNYEPKKPLPKLLEFPGGGRQAVFADGSVRTLKKTMKPEMMRLAITRDDGMPVNLDE